MKSTHVAIDIVVYGDGICMLYSWTFKFYKVVRQKNSGVVEDFILLYSAVYLRIQKWKNYWNQSTFATLIVKIKVAPFSHIVVKHLSVT